MSDPAPVPPPDGPVPAATPAPAGHVGPGIASVRGDIRGLRFLLYACTALVIVLVLVVGVAIVSLRTQVDDLRAQVAAAAQPVAIPPDVASAPTMAPSAAPTPQATGAAQLGAAADLTGVDLPDGADTTGAIVIGDPDATTVVETFIDFQCPFCQRWESMYGTALMQKALEPGSGIQVRQYNLAFLGETSPTLTPAGASARAASAAACVVDHDGPQVFAAFSRSLFETADPSEPPGQFTAEVLSALATKAGASADSLACIADETFVPFVAATTTSGFARGVTGTPTVVIDGKTIGNAFTDPAVANLVPQVS